MMEMLVVAGVVVPVLWYVFYWFMSWNFDHWRRKRVPHLEGSVPFGNVKDIIFLRRTMAQVYEDIYR